MVCSSWSPKTRMDRTATLAGRSGAFPRGRGGLVGPRWRVRIRAVPVALPVQRAAEEGEDALGAARLAVQRLRHAAGVVLAGVGLLAAGRATARAPPVQPRPLRR